MLKTEPATISGSIELRSLGLWLSLDDIYEDVDFARPARTDEVSDVVDG
jgi:hypothetical protein